MTGVISKMIVKFEKEAEANETKETHNKKELTKSSRLPDASLRIGCREGALYRGTCG